MAEYDRRSTQALRGGLSSSRMIAQVGIEPSVSNLESVHMTDIYLCNSCSCHKSMAQLRDGAARARRERFARRLVRWARLVRPAARHPPTPLIESRWSQFASEYQWL